MLVGCEDGCTDGSAVGVTVGTEDGRTEDGIAVVSVAPDGNESRSVLSNNKIKVYLPMVMIVMTVFEPNALVSTVVP